MGNQFDCVEDQSWPIPWCLFCKFLWTLNYIMIKVKWVREFDHVEDQSSPSPWCLLCKFVLTPNYIMIKVQWVRDDSWQNQISMNPTKILPWGAPGIDWSMKKKHFPTSICTHFYVTLENLYLCPHFFQSSLHQIAFNIWKLFINFSNTMLHGYWRDETNLHGSL